MGFFDYLGSGASAAAPSRIEVLQKIQRNPYSVAAWHPRADEMIPLNGISHERRSCADDNGMWLGDKLHWELQRVVACALANEGTAHIILDDNHSFTVNLSVAGYGGLPRWGGRVQGHLAGGRLFLREDARQVVQGKPGLETVGGNVVQGNVLSLDKIVTERRKRIHHHQLPDQHIHHHRKVW